MKNKINEVQKLNRKTLLEHVTKFFDFTYGLKNKNIKKFLKLHVDNFYKNKENIMKSFFGKN